MTNRLAAFSHMLPSDIDAVLITSEISRRYFLDFHSTAGTIVVTREKSYFIIDSRYYEVALENVKNCDVILQDKLYNQINELFKINDISKVGIESEIVTISGLMRLESKLCGVEILRDERVSRIIEKLRAVKDDSELECIAAAQEIADETFSHILDFIRPDITELEIAIELEQYARRLGSEEAAFSYIVAAGTNSSRPHATPSKNKVKDGDFVTLDFGATVSGYRSDMTRTVAVGSVSAKQREVYELVLKAQLAALDAVKAGVTCFHVDKIARDMIDSTGYKGLFGHGLGHSLGLEIHEPPRFNSECVDKLEIGMVMSVEPGIYIPGEFGVRIEDIVAVTEKGCRNFVKSNKNLIRI